MCVCVYAYERVCVRACVRAVRACVRACVRVRVVPAALASLPRSDAVTALQRQLFAGAAPPTAVEVINPTVEELGVLRRALVAFDSVVSVKVSSGTDDEPWKDDAVVAGFTALLRSGRQLRAVTYVPPRLEHACRCRGSRADFC
jgi:hypothetical protein